jgi:hypothetical protein
MQRRVLFAVLLTIGVALATASKAHAWGCYRGGYTHVGYGGVTHVGYGGAAGYGGYRGGYNVEHVGYGGTSAYHAGYAGGYGGYHAAYGTSYNSAYGVGGYHYGGVATPYGSAGYYRAW